MNLPFTSNDNCLTLAVPGDLISTTTESLRKDATALLDEASQPRRWNVFKLDLTAATMIDSAGLNLAVTLLKRIKSSGARMQIIYSNPNLLRTFVFTRLDQHVELIKIENHHAGC